MIVLRGNLITMSSKPTICSSTCRFRLRTVFRTITKNTGKLTNKGFEIVINSQNLIGEFKWSTNFNISHNVNNITDMGGAVITGGSRFLGQIRENEPMGVFYGKRYAGVDPANGDALYYLNAESNETTNVVEDAEEQVVGNPNPKFLEDWITNFHTRVLTSAYCVSLFMETTSTTSLVFPVCERRLL